MTKEVLKLARDWIAERPADRPVSAGKMISIIDRALAQPAQPAQGWKLREVYFDEHGEPIMHREPAQEPVAWVVEFENGEQELHFEEPSVGETITPLYTTPPQRPWVELTDEDIDNFFKAVWGPKVTPTDFIRSIEQALKEKNT